MSGKKNCWALLCIFILLLGTLCSVSAQTAGEYRLLVQQGEIPADFLADKDMNQALNVYGTRKSQEKFYVRNTFYLKQLITGGNVLFGDTVTAYLNKVADIILSDYPQLRKELRFYATRSPGINAFSSQSGIILVNIGLIANLENEAQLAFILCHEISHYTANHPQKLFIKKTEGGKNVNATEQLLKTQLYTPVLEQEADSIGFLLYIKSPYALSEALSACKLIRETALYSSVPENFYKNTSPFFPDTIPVYFRFQESLKELSPEEIFARKRKNKLLKMIPDKAVKGELCLNSSVMFDYIQKICRFEVCEYALEEQAYEKAIYLASFWANYYQSENVYLQKVKAYGWYGLVKYANTGRFWEVHEDYQVKDSAYGRFCYTIEQIQGENLHFLALKSVINSHKQYPDDLLLQRVEEELWKETGRYYINQIQEEGEILFSGGIKLPDLWSAQSSVFPLSKIRYLMLEGYKLKYSEEKNISEKARKQQQRKLISRGFNLGVDTIVAVEPTYQRVDIGQTGDDFEISTAMQTGLVQKIEEYSARQKLKTYLLYTRQLRETQVNSFRRLSILNQWFREKSITKELGIIGFRQEELKKIRTHYGTPYFAWIGGVHLLRKTDENNGFSLEEILALPFNTASRYETLYYTIVYDLRTEEYLIIYPRYVRMNNRADIFHSVIYDMLFQIKQKS